MLTVVVGLNPITLRYLKELGFEEREGTEDVSNGVYLPTFRSISLNHFGVKIVELRAKVCKVINFDHLRLIFFDVFIPESDKAFLPWRDEEIHRTAKERASFEYARTIGALC